jgi:hypothetical protein
LNEKIAHAHNGGACDTGHGLPELRALVADHNKIRVAYNHAKYLLQRRTMMQARADYLDSSRARTEATGSHQAGSGCLDRRGCIPTRGFGAIAVVSDTSEGSV